jgi:hypothetical protein
MRWAPSQEYACQINVLQLQRPCLNLERKELAAAVGLVVASGAIYGICERRRSQEYENHFAASVSGPGRSGATSAGR